jgi:hypothetical protein
LTILNQRSELVSRLLDAVATNAPQGIFRANDETEDCIAPNEALDIRALTLRCYKMIAQLNESTDHIGEVAIDLIGPVIERPVDGRNCRAASIVIAHGRGLMPRSVLGKPANRK